MRTFAPNPAEEVLVTKIKFSILFILFIGLCGIIWSLSRREVGMELLSPEWILGTEKSKYLKNEKIFQK